MPKIITKNRFEIDIEEYRTQLDEDTAENFIQDLKSEGFGGPHSYIVTSPFGTEKKTSQVFSKVWKKYKSQTANIVYKVRMEGCFEDGFATLEEALSEAVSYAEQQTYRQIGDSASVKIYKGPDNGLETLKDHEHILTLLGRVEVEIVRDSRPKNEQKPIDGYTELRFDYEGQ